MTVIKLTDQTLYYATLDAQGFNIPMSLERLTHVIHTDDPARVILYARYGSSMPSNILGVMK